MEGREAPDLDCRRSQARFFFWGGIIVHSAWGCVLWMAQWRAARALDSQLEGLVGPV